MGNTRPSNLVSFDGITTNYLLVNGVEISVNGSSTLSEVQFLATQATAGKLIIVSGDSYGAVAVICSYTPANGKTFTLYKGSWRIIGANFLHCTLLLRNNAVQQDIVRNNIAGTFTAVAGEFSVKGDQLIGDGAKTYDIDNSVNDGTADVSAGLTGYITP